MTQQAVITENSQHKARGGKYLTFCLAREDYGLEILKVREIIGMQDLTAVPRTASYVKGVMNLRGKVIPVIDLRMKLGMVAAETTRLTAIIVAQVDQAEVGLIVDKVSEVLDVDAKDIEDAPAVGDVDASLILGLGKTERGVTILLEIDKVLSGSAMVTDAESLEDDSAPDLESE